jgi:hypothetical protein
MDLCKIGTTIYIIVKYLQDPSTKIRYIEVKDINGNKKTVMEDSANPISSSERKTFEKELQSKSLVSAEPSSRFSSSAPVASSYLSEARTPAPVARTQAPATKPVGVYPQKSCNLPKRGNHKFQLSNLSAKYHGGIEGMIPEVRWEFIGYCILTDAESLDLFQFDASGKSAFQDNFFNYFDTLVSYCVEGNNHYACFTPTSHAIVEFVAKYLSEVQVNREVLKQYMSHAAIEEYRLFVEIKQREARRAAVLLDEQTYARQRELQQRREVQQREDAVRRERESRAEFARASVYAQPRLVEAAHSTVAASRAYPIALEQRAQQVALPIASPREHNFPSMDTINAAKRALGFPMEGHLTAEQECYLMHYLKTGQRPGLGDSTNHFACIARKSGRN